jgi:hypothetical protein
MSVRLMLGAVLLSSVVALPVLGADASAAGRSARPDARECTITGTSRSDTLRGTSGHDVICGRGGNDLLIGAGGSDSLRGGSGLDRLKGGTGQDLLAAGDGSDTLTGDDGDDTLRGGDGRDRLLGGDGGDVIAGGLGGDDINGGPLPDDIDGGAGFNTCTLDAQDVVDRCTYDLAPPVLVETRISEETVDVTNGDAVVTVSVHATDDTGISTVAFPRPQPWFPTDDARFVSGTARDGWWDVTLRFRQYSKPGTFVPRVRLRDRLTRETETDADASLVVRDDNPDLEAPQVVELASPLPTDVYDPTDPDYQGVPIEVRVTDAMSGVDTVSVTAHTWTSNGEWASWWGNGMRLVSGDEHDGVWRGRAWFGNASHFGGTWSLEFFVQDQANMGTTDGATYAGPVARQHRGGLPIPDGRGDFTMVGDQISETSTPEITAASLTPTEVHTLGGPAQVTFTVDAQDVGTGVNYVVAELSNPGYRFYHGLELTSGTSHNGTWTGQVTLPQGIAPGEFTPSVFIQDVDYNRTWYTARELSLPTVTVVDDSSP